MERLAEKLKACVESGNHLSDCDSDGFCNHCGHDEDGIELRLEYIRQELRAERISYGELAELQGLVEHIDEGDIELLQAAGVPENNGE